MLPTGFRSNAPPTSWTSTGPSRLLWESPFEDVNQTLSMFLGSLYVNSFNQFGRHWQVTVQADGEYRNRIEALNLFQVRNKRGEMVPLGTLVNVNQMKSDRGGPIVVTRYNLVHSRRRSPETCCRDSARATPSRPSTRRPTTAYRCR